MRLKECLKVSSLLLLTLVLSSCSSWPKLTQIEVQTVEVERNIPTQNRPQPINMNTTMRWWVVTEENFKEFKKKFQKENGDPLVAYVIKCKRLRNTRIKHGRNKKIHRTTKINYSLL